MNAMRLSYSNANVKLEKCIASLTPSRRGRSYTPTIVYPGWDGCWATFLKKLVAMPEFYNTLSVGTFFVTCDNGFNDVECFRVPRVLFPLAAMLMRPHKVKEYIIFLIGRMMIEPVPLAVVKAYYPEVTPWLEMFVEKFFTVFQGMLKVEEPLHPELYSLLVCEFSAWFADNQCKTKLVFNSLPSTYIGGSEDPRMAEYFSREISIKDPITKVIKLMDYLEAHPMSSRETLYRESGILPKDLRKILGATHRISRIRGLELYHIACGHVPNSHEDFVYLSTKDAPIEDIPVCSSCAAVDIPIVFSYDFDETYHSAVATWNLQVVHLKSTSKKKLRAMAKTVFLHPVNCSIDFPYVPPSIIKASAGYFKYKPGHLMSNTLRKKILVRIATTVDYRRAECHRSSINDSIFSAHPGVYFFAQREGRYRSYFSTPYFLYYVAQVLGSNSPYESETLVHSSSEHCSSPSEIMSAIYEGRCYIYDGEEIRPGHGLSVGAMDFLKEASDQEYESRLLERLEGGPLHETNLRIVAGENYSAVLAGLVADGIVTSRAGFVKLVSAPLTSTEQLVHIQKFRDVMRFFEYLPGSTSYAKIQSFSEIFSGGRASYIYSVLNALRTNRNICSHGGSPDEIVPVLESECEIEDFIQFASSFVSDWILDVVSFSRSNVRDVLLTYAGIDFYLAVPQTSTSKIKKLCELYIRFNFHSNGDFKIVELDKRCFGCLSDGTIQ